MNIVFIGLASCYAPGMTYQDNMLCAQTLADGHHVTYISAPLSYRDGVMIDVPPEDTVLPDGLHLIRLPYVKCGSTFLTKKLRLFRGVYDILAQEKPDVIFVHQLSFGSVGQVIRYKRAHPEVKLYADTHTAYDNSGTNWLSLHILHRIYYRWLIRKALPHLEKYFYIGESEHIFSKEVYGVPEALMEFYPLGGNIPSEEAYANWRKVRREELGVPDGKLLFVHAGKLEPKKRTADLLTAFAAVPELNATLAVIGSIPDELKPVLLPMMEKDERVKYLGWKSGTELQEYLCAADLYCQPGKVSAIYQNALCCRVGALVYPHLPYTRHYEYGQNLWVKNTEDMFSAFRGIASGELDVQTLRAGAVRCANELLDYRALAARLYR